MPSLRGILRRHALMAISAALVIGLYLASRWRAQRSSPPPPPSPFDVRLAEFRYRGPLAGALHELGRTAHVRLQADWPSLQEVGIAPDSAIDLQLRSVTTAQVLGAIRFQLRPETLMCELRPDRVIHVFGRPPEKEPSYEEPVPEQPIMRMYAVSRIAAYQRQGRDRWRREGIPEGGLWHLDASRVWTDFRATNSNSRRMVQVGDRLLLWGPPSLHARIKELIDCLERSLEGAEACSGG